MRFPKSARLLSRSDYRRLASSGQRITGKNLVVDYRFSKYPVSRLGLTVSKRFGKAHDRNRFKRLVREAFRQLSIPEGLEINVHPKQPSYDLSLTIIKEELKHLAHIALTESTAAKGHTRN